MLCGQTFPGFAFVYKYTSLVDEMENEADDLFRSVGSVTDGVITTVFDPVEKGINWLIDVVRGAEDRFVFL